jgi:RNA polymerase sigma-70 factor (ECF subfamily)
VQHQTDAEILSMIRKEESRNQGFNLLIIKYQQKVYMLVRRMVFIHSDADDITQETFIKVYEKINQFREESGLFTWIYRIATNEALTFLKKKKRRNLLVSDSSKDLADKLNEDPLFDGDDIQRKLFDAVDKLPTRQKLVFNMKYFEEMKYEEIARMLDISVGALKTSYHHAVKKITKYVTLD